MITHRRDGTPFLGWASRITRSWINIWKMVSAKRSLWLCERNVMQDWQHPNCFINPCRSTFEQDTFLRQQNLVIGCFTFHWSLQGKHGNRNIWLPKWVQDVFIDPCLLRDEKLYIYQAATTFLVQLHVSIYYPHSQATSNQAKYCHPSKFRQSFSSTMNYDMSCRLFYSRWLWISQCLAIF